MLVLNGRGIIHRNYTTKSESIPEIFKSLFPDSKADDFYVQITETTSGGVLSLIRKDIVVGIVKDFDEKQVILLALSLGPFITPYFLKIAQLPVSELKFEHYSIYCDASGIITEYKNVPEKYADGITLGEDVIPAIYLNAYSAACSYLFHKSLGIEYPGCTDTFFLDNEGTYKTSIYKKRGGLVLLVCVLLVLLVNFFIYSSLREKNINLENHLQGYQNKLKHLDSLESYIHIKKEFIEKAGWSEKIILSKYCDEIALTVPEEIRLTELTVHPLNISESRKTKESIFDNRKIVIKGATKRIVVLNDWLKKIVEKVHIKELKMDEYHFDQASQEGFFILEGEID